jgi:antitoxin ParD1/3/4
MSASARTVSLTSHQQEFLDAQVVSGRHGNASEVVREALRRYEDDVLREQAHLDYLRRLGDEGEAEIAQGKGERMAADQISSYIRGLAREARQR